MEGSLFVNQKWKHIAVLLLAALLAYLPVSLGILSLKNDAMVYFLPWRYQISESIQNGYFPFWSPYLYTGLPLHSDIQSGFWNPVVLFISSLTRYNMTVLGLEVVFYIFMAGVGMYKLCREFKFSSLTALIAAISYMCCGFMTDSGSLIPWITSAAWLPFVFTYFKRLTESPSLPSAIKLAISLFLLFTAGYPSFFIYASYILLSAIIVWIVKAVKEKRNPAIRSFLLWGSVSLILFLLLSLPAIISYWEFLGYYERGSNVALENTLSNSFPPFSSISYLLPQTVVKPHPWIHADLTARNAYTGIIVLLFLFLLKTRPGIYKFIWGILIFSFLFSLGEVTPLREWCYRVLPLMDSFRHPASMRIFTTICVILLSGYMLDGFLKENSEQFNSKLKIALYAVLILVAAITIYYLSKQNIFKSLNNNFSSSQSVKEFLDALSFSDIAVVQGLIQLFFLAAFIVLIKRKQQPKNLLAGLMILNSIVFAWQALPFTFVSQYKTSTVNHYISLFPKGFPKPDLTASVNSDRFYDTLNPYLFGPEIYYNKRIEILDHVITPTLNRDYDQFLQNTKLRNELAGRPFAWLEDSGTVKVISFTPNKFVFEVRNEDPSTLNLFQQYNHNWKAIVNKNRVTIKKSHQAFMAVDLPTGNNIVEFTYRPQKVIVAIFIAIITMLSILIYFIFKRFKKNS